MAVINYSAYYKNIKTTFGECFYYSISSPLSQTANKRYLNIDDNFL